jgi:hypothetical protein
VKIRAVIETAIYVDDLNSTEAFYGIILCLRVMAKEPGRHSCPESEVMNLKMAGNGIGDSTGDVTPQTVEEVFTDDARRGEFVILEADENTFLQASGEGDGPYLLEYKNSGQQFQAVNELTKQEAKEAFLDYFRGGSDWRTKRQWKQVPIKKGCFKQTTALLLLLGVAALLLIR